MRNPNITFKIKDFKRLKSWEYRKKRKEKNLEPEWSKNRMWDRWSSFIFYFSNLILDPCRYRNWLIDFKQH